MKTKAILEEAHDQVRICHTNLMPSLCNDLIFDALMIYVKNSNSILHFEYASSINRKRVMMKILKWKFILSSWNFSTTS
jgi:hypothetical protein